MAKEGSTEKMIRDIKRKTRRKYSCSKEFMEAGKVRLAGNTKRQASSGEVNTLGQENEQLKQLVAELTLKNRV